MEAPKENVCSQVSRRTADDRNVFGLQVAEAAAATREEEREARMNKSPSDFSCQSYEMFVGGQGAPPEGRSSPAGGGPGGGNGHGADGDYSIREKMSIKSDDVDSLLGGGNVSDSRMKINGRVRKVITTTVAQLDPESMSQ